ncbi:MAG: hypothetical protein ACUVQ9_12540 [Thermodesulfobacteriota bacterium]
MIKKTQNKLEDSNGNQKDLFEPVARWLESKGYYSLITHERKEIGLWIGDLFPSKLYIEPDVVGVRSSWIDTICIEVEVKQPIEILGKCTVWKLITDKVYMAYPKQSAFKIAGFQKLNIGLLEVSDDHIKEVYTPRVAGNWDTSKSQEFFNQVWNVIRSQSRESMVQITEINAYKYEKKWNVTVKFRNTGSNELALSELLINGKTPQEISGVNLTSKFPTTEKPLLIEPFKEDCIYMEMLESELFNSGSQVEFCLEAKEKGKHVQKIRLP